MMHLNYHLQKKIKKLENNQKPKIIPEEGVIYIFKASDSGKNSLYKIGRTTNLKRRMTQYQSSHANNIDILFIYKCKNLKLVERCIKSLAVNYQYRSYKEIYEININILKKITKYCDMLTQYFKKSKLSKSDTTGKLFLTTISGKRFS